MTSETLAFLRCHDLAVSTPDAVFIDATLGTAGHTLEILKAHPTCRVIAFDRDRDSMQFARERLQDNRVLERVTTILGDFRDAHELLKPYFENQKVGADGRPIARIDGALVDAGMSLWQVTNAQRGISFRGVALLDMRYDRDQNYSAFDLVNRLSPQELEDVLFKFADERWARRIAAVIAEHRSRNVIRTTSELVSLIEAAIPVGVRRQSRVHPATQTFAALRLAVNDEFGALDKGAWSLMQVLAPAARLVILTYSSNEDRIVKRTFRFMAGRTIPFEEANPRRKKKSQDFAKNQRDFATTRSSLTFSEEPRFQFPNDQAPSVPDWIEGFDEKWQVKIVTPKPLAPTDAEIESNPLSRSCKLRAIEKLEIKPAKRVLDSH